MSNSNVLQAPIRNAADRAWGESEVWGAAAAYMITALLPLTAFLDATVYPVAV